MFDEAFGFKETEVLQGRKQQVFWEGNEGQVRVPPLSPVAIIAIDDILKLLNRVRKYCRGSEELRRKPWILGNVLFQDLLPCLASLDKVSLRLVSVVDFSSSFFFSLKILRWKNSYWALDNLYNWASSK